MTRAVYQSMFVSLSVLFMAALFVLQPTENPEMLALRADLGERFTQAATELMAGESFVEPFALVWSSVDSFYDESTDQALVLLEDDTLARVALMFNADYLSDVEIAASPIIARAPTEEPLMNIVPMSEAESLLDPYFNEDLAYMEEFGGVVAGESIDINEEESRPPVVWMTINDSITAFPYCVAVFNGTINSYPGACAKDDLTQIHEN